jgi:adenylate kinase family enzyme
MRIAVIGTSGAGKTTLSGRLAERLGLPHLELDAINWQADWRDLMRHDPDEFVRRVTQAVAAPSWVVEGNYSPVRAIVWQRATHLVWLDYERGVIMRRVIPRSLRRVALRTPLWAGNRERWSFLLQPDHPIRWAWSTWARRRQETEALLADPAYRHLVTMRLRHPREAADAIERLAGVAACGRR